MPPLDTRSSRLLLHPWALAVGHIQSGAVAEAGSRAGRMAAHMAVGDTHPGRPAVVAGDSNRLAPGEDPEEDSSPAGRRCSTLGWT